MNIRIKPLDWYDDSNEELRLHCVALSLNGTYNITPQYRLSFCPWGGTDKFMGDFANIADAKAEAFRDHERVVRKEIIERWFEDDQN
jgi:hypothetical protein